MSPFNPCHHCQNYSGTLVLPCAIHPSGAPANCPDFAAKPAELPAGEWEPEGASYYDGQLVLQPEQRLTLEQKRERLDWHPLFTGRCPNCELPMETGDRLQPATPVGGIWWRLRTKVRRCLA